MAITPTLRFLLKQYGSGEDPHPNRAEFNLMIDALENNAAMFSQGITGARPAAGKRGRIFWDETTNRLYYDTGTDWKDANPNGGGGAGLALAIGGAGSEGTSARAARADHTHPLPLATSAVNGAMPATDKAKLDAATAAATADTLARRDASGRLSIATPTAGGHATTKTYVDGLITDTVNYVNGEVDAIRTICTSTTRPALALRFDGMMIYETDTKRELQWYAGDGWQAIRCPMTLYTPTWGGFNTLNAAAVGGSYMILGPRFVRMNAFLRVAAGTSWGGGPVSVSLPFPAAGYPQQLGNGSHLVTGPSGVSRPILGVVNNGSTGAQLWATPDQAQNGLTTMGAAGFALAVNTEIHFNLTYETDNIR